jgi:protein TonB
MPAPITRPLAIWVAVSILAHLVIIWGAGRLASTYARPAPLQVELRTVVTESREPLAAAGAEPELDLPLRAQDTAQPDIAPSTTRPSVDIPNALSLPLNIYYASNEVDTRAEPLNDVDLVYPLLAYQDRVRGMVRLNIFVNEKGGIDKVAVVDAKPPGVFENAALQAVAELKFSPAIKNGRPVKNRKTIEVAFDPYEKINTP